MKQYKLTKAKHSIEAINREHPHHRYPYFRLKIEHDLHVAPPGTDKTVRIRTYNHTSEYTYCELDTIYISPEELRDLVIESYQDREMACKNHLQYTYRPGYLSLKHEEMMALEQCLANWLWSQ